MELNFKYNNDIIKMVILLIFICSAGADVTSIRIAFRRSRIMLRRES